MQYDPISTWLMSINSTFGRVVLFLAAVLIGSWIPMFSRGGPVDWPMMLVGFPLTLMMACVVWGTIWGPLCLLAWLSVPLLLCFFYSYIFEQAAKRDLFMGFSIAFFIFLSFPCSSGYWAYPLLIYAMAALGYWGLPRLLAWRRG